MLVDLYQVWKPTLIDNLFGKVFCDFQFQLNIDGFPEISQYGRGNRESEHG